MRETFGNKVLEQEIKERVAVAKSAAKKKPIYDMGDQTAASQFRAVSRALLKRMGVIQ
jgi:cellulose biosynthesis protein BcsQ